MKGLKKFFEWLVWYWRTRKCQHPVNRIRRIGGEERMTYGYNWRCLDCDKPLGKN